MSVTVYGQAQVQSNQEEHQLFNNSGALTDSIFHKRDTLRDKEQKIQEKYLLTLDTLPILKVARLPSHLPGYSIQPKIQKIPDVPAYKDKLDALSKGKVIDRLDKTTLGKNRAILTKDIKQKSGKVKQRANTLKQQRAQKASNLKRSKERFADKKQAYDSLNARQIADTAQQVVTSSIENAVQKHLAKQQELPEAPMAPDIAQDAIRESLTHEAQDFFAANTAQLQSAQQKLSSLKQKYSKLQQHDSVFVKASSLQDKPTKERFIYGFNLNRKTWSSLTASPYIGFHVNKVLVVGAGTLVNAGWQTTPWQIHSTLSGTNAFLQYYLPKDFLVQVEYALEKQSSRTNDQISTEWQQKIYLGAGKQVNFTKKIALQVLFMVNVLPDHSPVAQQRFQVRIGLLKNAY